MVLLRDGKGLWKRKKKKKMKIVKGRRRKREIGKYLD